jgi:hypothetical protein
VVVLFAFASYPLALAADTTPPIRPIVKDDGDYTHSTTQLHAVWLSGDPQSGIQRYRYRVTQNSRIGSVVIPWTLTQRRGITQVGLKLQEGKIYYFSVRAENRVGLWSRVGFSNGIIVDSIAPRVQITYPEEGQLLGSS